MLLLPLPVLADANVMYANGDTIPVLDERDINSEVLETYHGGDRVLIEYLSDDQQWAAVIAMDPSGDGQTLGWIPMSALSYTMPERYCNHQWSDWVVYTQPTCTQEGLRTRSCQICGATENQVIEKTAHTFGPWTVTRQATCTTEGEVMHSCMVCGYQERSVIEKTGHTFMRREEITPLPAAGQRKAFM